MMHQIRRLVAGTEESGTRGTILSDELLDSSPISIVPGATVSSIWVTFDSLPTKNNHTSDDGLRRIDPTENFGLVPLVGTNFQSTELPPNAVTPMHRTSSLDYNILIDGEVLLIMEDGTEEHLKHPGDTVVMKGVMHAWKNPSATRSVRWISILMSAEPVRIGPDTLKPELR